MATVKTENDKVQSNISFKGSPWKKIYVLEIHTHTHIHMETHACAHSVYVYMCALVSVRVI